MLFENKNILITGGTGSLGSTLLRRLLSGDSGLPTKIRIFSRDEAKQSALKAQYAMDDTLGFYFKQRVEFQIGDVRDYFSIANALRDIDIVFNTAALKQVPTCEYHPYEAVQTNIKGPENIVRAIRQGNLPIHTVVGISTDKACKPVNVMGMTKAIQERLFLSANCSGLYPRYICVRYGNVLASRGSVIPLFKDQIAKGGPVTLTTPNMTRFLLSLDAAVDAVFAAVRHGYQGETYIPRIPSARVTDIASIMIGKKPIETKFTGIRPGEKIHEILISEEEIYRTREEHGYYIISSVLCDFKIEPALTREFSSANVVMSKLDVEKLLQKEGLLD